MTSFTYVLREGFWKPNNSISESALPVCPPGKDKLWKGKGIFLKALDSTETSARRTKYKGYSTCRLCGENNGDEELSLKRGGVTAVWPSGYRHYIKTHNVRPSLAFQEFVERREIK